MNRKLLAFLLIAVLTLGLAACTPSQPADTNGEEPGEEEADDNWKIGIMTNTVVQNEEEYRAAQNVLARYGEDHVIHMTFPDKFMDERRPQLRTW